VEAAAKEERVCFSLVAALAFFAFGVLTFYSLLNNFFVRRASPFTFLYFLTLVCQ